MHVEINPLKSTHAAFLLSILTSTCWASRMFLLTVSGHFVRGVEEWSSYGSPVHKQQKIKEFHYTTLHRWHSEGAECITETPSPAEPSSSAVPAARSAPPGSGRTPGWWGRSSLPWKAPPPGASAGRCLENLSGSLLWDVDRQEKNVDICWMCVCAFEKFFPVFEDNILELIKRSIIT